MEPDAEGGLGPVACIVEGASPMLCKLCNSGAAGLGTNIVLRTSRRPRSVLDRFGAAACCKYVRYACISTIIPFLPLPARY